jgi:ribosome-binding protein aMBF1 (putative translation factor)
MDWKKRLKAKRVTKKRLPLDQFRKKSRADAARNERKRQIIQELATQQEKLQELLRETRKSRGFTQAQLGRKLGRDQTFVAKIENGTRTVTFLEMEQIARAYGVALDDFRTMDKIEPVRSVTYRSELDK